ncbi:hypothetical protein MCUN1_000293 [Malassezia cuniculi]|uniref:TATA-binding protein interacting (TIP20) domain-containing protein n=1 Tax=Malassezia cuniculi TaxID=948313 RepID=A0AAF0J4W9_9BASI|nr:hypothetical protein MCUN1_000293 [Malassezia cuniculi]
MALNDLVAVIDRKSSLSGAVSGIEEMTVKQVISLLRDHNAEVKNLAVNTIVSLVPKISSSSYGLVIKSLVQWMLSNDEEERDIAVLTLRTIVDGISSSPKLAGTLVSEAAPGIVSQLKQPSASQAQQNDAFDVLNSILQQIPLSVVQYPTIHQDVLDTLLHSLLSPRAVLSKRAVAGIGSYSTIASPEAYSIIVTRISETLRSPPSTSAKWLNVRTMVQLIAVLARSSPRRLRPESPALVQHILHVLSTSANQESEAEEVSEACLHALGALFTSSVAPGSVQLEPVVQTSLALLRYDPNYAGFEDEDEEFVDDDEELIMENYSDDDDISWKVRRAAAKFLAVLVSKHLSTLGQLLTPISATLVAAIAEREETVRLEVLATLTMLLEQLHQVDIDVYVESVDTSTNHKRKRSVDETSSKRMSVSLIEPQLGPAVESLCKQAASRMLPTRIASIDALAQLVAVFGPTFTPYTEPVFATLYKIFQGGDTAGNVQGKSLRLAVVGLIEQMCLCVPAQLPGELPFLVSFLVDTISETNHRNALAVLRASSTLVRCVFPLRLDAELSVSEHIQRIYGASLARLERNDSDQLLKNACIDTIGVLVSCVGDHLGASLNDALSVILDRLPLEVTRASCIAAIRDIVPSARVRDRAEVHRFGIASIEPLLGISRLSDHGAVEASLSCLREVVAALNTRIPHSILVAIVQTIEKNAQIDRDAKHAAALTVLASLVVQTDASMSVALEHAFLPSIYSHLVSPMLPAGVLEALTALLRVIGSSNQEVAFATVQSLLSVWASVCTEQGHKMENQTAFLSHAPVAFAQSISAVAVSEPVVQATLHRAVAILHGNIADSVLGLHIVGSLGCNGSLVHWNEIGTMFGTALHIYGAGDERSGAAAFALGGLLLSAPSQFLPRIFDFLKPADVSLSLQGLRIVKESLAHASVETLGVISAELWPRLFAVGEALELTAANQALFDTCYECIARMVFADPAHYIDQLDLASRSQSASVRAFVLGAVRSTLTLDRSHTLDVVLSSSLWRFLLLLDDENLTVCRLAVMALHSALYNRREIVFEHIGVLIPKLLQHTNVREELKRKVAMGPFTVVIDDGLDLRKNTYETLFTLLEKNHSTVDLPGLIGRIVPGLDDDDAIKQLVCLILVRIADQAPQTLSNHLDDISTALLSITSRKARDNATKQEIEKINELVQAALRVVIHIEPIHGVSISSKFVALLEHIQKSPYAETYRSMAYEVEADA